MKTYLLQGLLLTVVLTAVLFLWSGLPTYPHKEDSVATMTVLDRIVAGDFPVEDPTFRRSPVGHLLMAVPVWLLGPSEYTYRTANLVFMALTMLVVAWMGRALGFHFAGLAAAAVIGFSPVEGLVVSYVRFYAIFQFFFMYCWFLTIKFVESEERKYLLQLSAAIILALFVHKLSLQIFVVVLTALLFSRKWHLLKDRGVVAAFAAIFACAIALYFSRSLTLAAEDYNELMIGNIGDMFRSGQPLLFYHDLKEYFPLLWSFVLWGLFLAGYMKKSALLSCGVAFVILFASVVVLAPGDGSYYYAHLLPAGVLFALVSLEMTVLSARDSMRRRRGGAVAAVTISPLVIAAALCAAGYDKVNPSLALGQDLKFHDQQLPHRAMQERIGATDAVLSTDPGLSRYYLKRPVVHFLRQRRDERGQFGGFPGGNGNRELIDSTAKLLDLLNATAGSVWIYGNYKYQQSVGPELRNMINRHVREVVYYDEPGKLFVLRLSSN